jgi:hypothetical protein
MGLGISVQVLIRLFEGEISDYAFVSWSWKKKEFN